MNKSVLLFLVFNAAICFKALPQTDPSCACSNAETVLNLAGKHLMYNELAINVLYDNSIILTDNISGQFYKVKSGSAKGPLSANDPEIAPFMNPDNNDPLYSTFREFIIKEGDKYLIKFRGSVYGPYYEINRFYLTKSGDSFLATVSEKESLGLKLEKLNRMMSEATTDKQREELQAQNLKLVQEELAAGDDPASYVKVISNISGARYNIEGIEYPDAEVKFDEILLGSTDDNGQLIFSTLQGKRLITIKREHAYGQVYLNSTNTRYAVYENGTLTFSDSSTKSDLFSPYLAKVDGKVHLSYFYYSPVRNSIMQCRILF